MLSTFLFEKKKETASKKKEEGVGRLGAGQLSNGPAWSRWPPRSPARFGLMAIVFCAVDKSWGICATKPWSHADSRPTAHTRPIFFAKEIDCSFVRRQAWVRWCGKSPVRGQRGLAPRPLAGRPRGRALAQHYYYYYYCYCYYYYHYQQEFRVRAQRPLWLYALDRPT